MTEHPENRAFSLRLEFALDRYKEINREHLENARRLRKSPHLVERIIGMCAPVAHLALAYTLFPFAIAVAMTDAEYSKDKDGYISRSYREWLEAREEN